MHLLYSSEYSSVCSSQNNWWAEKTVQNISMFCCERGKSVVSISHIIIAACITSVLFVSAHVFKCVKYVLWICLCALLAKLLLPIIKCVSFHAPCHSVFSCFWWEENFIITGFLSHEMFVLFSASLAASRHLQSKDEICVKFIKQYIMDCKSFNLSPSPPTFQ